MGRLARGLSTAVAGGVLAGVAVLYLRTEWLLAAVPDLASLIAELDPVVALVVATALVGAAAVLLVVRAKLFGSGRTVSTAASRTESAQSLFAGAGNTRGEFGAAFDATVETATNYGSIARTDREAAREQSVAELRSLATESYRQSTGCDTETAQQAIDAGEWTADRRAAGLLADDSGPSIPLRLWAWDLLFGRDPYKNSLEHTLTVLETISVQEATE